MNRTLIAVDPGKSGGIAWTFGGKCAVDKMPQTEQDIFELIRRIQHANYKDDVTCYMEDVPISMGSKGAASAKLNANAGFIRGVITALSIRMVMTRPAKWQQHFSLGTRSGCASDTEWKNKLKQAAQRLYPDIKVTLDTADALLLLEYGRTRP